VAKVIQRVPVAVPGLVIYLGLWLLVLLQFDYANATTNSIDTLWQSLGIDYLSTDPIASLSVLHIQPWGVNALYATDLVLSPNSHLFLLLLFLAAGAGAVALLGATLVRVGLARGWAVGACVVLALLPGTVLYTFWSYNVTLISFLAIAAVWGLARMRTQPVLGSAVSAGAVLGLQLMRSTFVWVFVLAWCVFLFVLLIRARPGRRLLISALPVFIVLVLSLLAQGYYWVNYQMPAMSSWSGQNVAKALITSGQLSVTDSARAEISADPCLSSLLVAYESQTLNVWDPGGLVQLPGCQSLVVSAQQGIPAWDQDYRESGELNYNSRLALAASGEWNRLMRTIVIQDPMQLVRMAITTDTGPRSSGIGIYLDPSDEFPWLDQTRSVLPLGSITGLLSIVFAPALVVLILIGIGQAIFVRTSFLRRNTVYWGALAVVVFHAAASTLAEYAENMRFRAEIDPLLILLGVISLYAITSSSRETRASAEQG
jgi:hypothetical protein